MISLVSRYPRSWRDRYEGEFLVLMADRPPDVLDRVDIVRAAFDARMHPQVYGEPVAPADHEMPYDGPWSARRSGGIAFVGGLIGFATLDPVAGSLPG